MTISKKVRGQAFTLWKSGLTQAKIAELLDISAPSVGTFVRENPKYAKALRSRDKLLALMAGRVEDRAKGRGKQVAQGKTARVYKKVAEPYKAQRDAKAARAERYYRAYVEGETLQEIANSEKLSRQRVEQILSSHQGYVDLRSSMRQGVKDKAGAYQLWLRGYTYKALATHYDISPYQAKKIIESNARFTRDQENRPQYQDAQHVQRMVDYYNGNHTLEEVASKFGYKGKRHTGVAPVWRVLSKHPDYKPRGRGWRK